MLPFHLRLVFYGVVKNGATCTYAYFFLVLFLSSLIYIRIIVGPMEFITLLVVSFDGHFSYVQKERNVSITHSERSSFYTKP